MNVVAPGDSVAKFKSYKAQATFGFPPQPAPAAAIGLWYSLGAGRDGVVFMASTVPPKVAGEQRVSAFVVKVYHDAAGKRLTGQAARTTAGKECDNLRRVYVASGLMNQRAFQVLQLGDTWALAEPYFEETPTDQRSAALAYLRKTVFPAFSNAWLKLPFHKDEVHWRHVLSYTDTQGNIRYMFVDLANLVDIPKLDGRRRDWEKRAFRILQKRAHPTHQDEVVEDDEEDEDEEEDEDDDRGDDDDGPSGKRKHSDLSSSSTSRHRTRRRSSQRKGMKKRE